MLGNDEFEAMSKNGVLKVAFPGVGVEGREADHFGVLLGVWGVQVGVEIEERKVEVSVGILPLHPEEVSSAFGSTRKFVGSPWRYHTERKGICSTETSQHSCPVASTHHGADRTIQTDLTLCSHRELQATNYPETSDTPPSHNANARVYKHTQCAGALSRGSVSRPRASLLSYAAGVTSTQRSPVVCGSP